MADDKPQTVKVKALQAHTAFGKAYDVDDEYDIDEAFVTTVVVQGKAERVEQDEAKPKKASHPVEPMTTDDFKPKKK